MKERRILKERVDEIKKLEDAAKKASRQEEKS